MRNRFIPSSCLLGALLVAGSGCDTPPTPIDQDFPVELPAPDARGSAAELTAPGCSILTTASVTASGDDGTGSVAANSQDDNLTTRWSGPGKGAWLNMDLGASKSVAGATVVWHQGNTRQNYFVISTSTDGTNFTQAFSGTSALNTSAQTYAFSARQARYVRVTVNGNTVNDWASILEARACAQQTTPPAPTADSGPVLPRLPYLQSVGQTSAIVAFRSGVSCTPFVRYGEGTDLSRTATATAAGWRHAVKLTGLQPGRTYGYSVEACGSVTGVRSFRTASAPGTPRVRFTTMGDFGTGGSSQKAVFAMMNKPEWRGEFLVALGDNAYSSGTEQEFQDRMFTPMAPLLREVPMFPSLGNHEYVTNQGQPYLDNFYLPTNNPAGTERYYSFDWGNVHFVALDSNCAIGLASSDRCTTAAQKAWLETDLAATTQPWKIVFFHHPPWSSGEHGSQLSMRRNYGPILEKYNVDLVLTGHDHNYERSKPMKGDAVAPAGTRGIVYLVVGSGGATLRTFPAAQPSWTAVRDNQVYGFMDVVVDGGTLTAKLITSTGSVRDSLTLTKTLPAVTSTQTSALKASSMETAPGPVDDPARAPAGLRFEKELPPADRLEDVADHDEPAPEASTPAAR
ncbi:serine/threonine protein phosphatase [Pyxidicoccus fallax]|uniref:Serine/threonine protein phosphatase n=1 Tax=Pyxidicoccus fallax TaxID=394095 RepID=A0A848L8L6_9BACT|nr:metallophosphoesterase [Pyxidicoccus fallax]NMO14944.1 serine/threonine protein phosphatase [Pyxidicoccus fallax]NPC77520.1 serine/threonine protein phosphatase [Pyxidicoccus fallax]